jgi:hypothetical protein
MTAEEMADNVIVKWMNLYVNGPVQNPDKLRKFIADALKSYRSAALEDAAKLCEAESDLCDMDDNAEMKVWGLADKIRSLTRGGE